MVKYSAQNSQINLNNNLFSTKSPTDLRGLLVLSQIFVFAIDIDF